MPQGTRFHVVWFAADGFHVLDLWDSQADFERFVERRLMPAVQKNRHRRSAARRVRRSARGLRAERVRGGASVGARRAQAMGFRFVPAAGRCVGGHEFGRALIIDAAMLLRREAGGPARRGVVSRAFQPCVCQSRAGEIGVVQDSLLQSRRQSNRRRPGPAPASSAPTRIASVKRAWRQFAPVSLAAARLAQSRFARDEVGPRQHGAEQLGAPEVLARQVLTG